jgi:hypothetical protein
MTFSVHGIFQKISDNMRDTLGKKMCEVGGDVMKFEFS